MLVFGNKYNPDFQQDDEMVLTHMVKTSITSIACQYVREMGEKHSFNIMLVPVMWGEINE